MRRLLSLSFLSLLGWQSLLAASNLTWEKDVLEINAGPLEERVDAVFRFTNTGKTKVSIVTMVASCGCAVPQLAQATYAPGEKGDLHVIFTPDDRVGLRQEQVTLLTDEVGQRPHVLVLRVEVPKLYEAPPYFAIWHGGEEASPKKIKIHLFEPNLLSATGIHARDSRVNASLEKDPYSNGNYVAVIQPSSTATAFESLVIVDLAAANGAKRSITLYAIVRASVNQSAQRNPAAGEAKP